MIESNEEPPAQDAPYGVYRCRQHMRALLIWLRSKGVVSRSPLHSSRKEFASQVHPTHGMLAASERLRHGNVNVTSRHYIENRRRATRGLGHLLKDDREHATIVPMPAEHRAAITGSHM